MRLKACALESWLLNGELLSQRTIYLVPNLFAGYALIYNRFNWLSIHLTGGSRLHEIKAEERIENMFMKMLMTDS